MRKSRSTFWLRTVHRWCPFRGFTTALAITLRWANWQTRSVILLGINRIRGLFSSSLRSLEPCLFFFTNTMPVGELAHHDHPQFPYPMASYKKASFGLVTPMTEAATLVGVSQHLRSVGCAQRSIRPPVLLDYLENIQYYIPGTSHFEATPAGLIPGYIALILLSAMACALGCVVLARRSAFSGVRAIGWAVIGFMFGWVGLILMLVLQEWPARVSCPECRKLRVVTRDTCEHCGALHAAPARDGTEIFEPIAAIPLVSSNPAISFWPTDSSVPTRS